MNKGKRSWPVISMLLDVHEHRHKDTAVPAAAFAVRAHWIPQMKMLNPLQPTLAGQTKPFPDTLSSQGHTNRAGHGSLELICLTICSWTLLLACRNACCSSLRKFSDFWHLAMSKEILKKENTGRHVTNKAWNRFWKRNEFSRLLSLLIGT